jgi:hypothetical protein
LTAEDYIFATKYVAKAPSKGQGDSGRGAPAGYDPAYVRFVVQCFANGLDKRIGQQEAQAYCHAERCAEELRGIICQSPLLAQRPKNTKGDQQEGWAGGEKIGGRRRTYEDNQCLPKCHLGRLVGVVLERRTVRVILEVEG